MHHDDQTLPQTEPLPVWKRALDITCCIVALPFLAVAAFWATLITLAVSPGPILFRQERVGLLGRRFHLYKFRTMHVSANVATHQLHFARLVKSNVPMEKLDARGDRRLILGGWLLRASGLDELPQIINVLRGEMSIVGPRPCIPYEYEQYSVEQRNRLMSVPGLTGLWQVSGKNRTTFNEMVQLDIAYAGSKSFALDVWIMARTLPALCRQISDTRKARKAAAEVAETEKVAETGKAAPMAAIATAAKAASTTFLTKSQDVVSAAGEQPQGAARQFSATYSPVRRDHQLGPARPHVDSAKSRK
jgi:lipopolysaccharide/colanic/teichoic acid biosynthesis glycosyltransferase